MEAFQGKSSVCKGPEAGVTGVSRDNKRLKWLQGDNQEKREGGGIRQGARWATQAKNLVF